MNHPVYNMRPHPHIRMAYTLYTHVYYNIYTVYTQYMHHISGPRYMPHCFQIFVKSIL